MWFTSGNEASSIANVLPDGDRLVLFNSSNLFLGSFSSPPELYRNRAMLQTAVSANLTSWSAQGIPTGAYWTAAGFGNGRFVAFGRIMTDYEEEPVYGSYIDLAIYSDDGLSWKFGSIVGSAKTWGYTTPQVSENYIMHTGGKFAAINGSVVVTSNDGITWQTSASIHPTNQSPHQRAAGNGIFLYQLNASAGLLYYTSTNGTSWTQRSWPTFSGVYYGFDGYTDITFNGGMFIATTSYKAPSSNFDIAIIKSTDGINWTRIPSPPVPSGSTTLSIASVSIDDSGTYAFFNGQFNGGYRLHIPTNTWQLSDQNQYNTKYSGYSNGKFYCISGNNISTSPDGITWTRHLGVIPWTTTSSQMLILDGQHS